MKRHSKIFNIFAIVLEVIFEIILLPFHIASAIIEVIKEIRR